MKEFVTRYKDELENEEFVDDGEFITFMHDDTEVLFYEPNAAQMTVMLGMRNRIQEDLETAETLITFMFEIMDRETKRYFQNRLLTREDPFGLESEGGLLEIFEWLSEEWSGKAIKQPSDYQKPRSQTGRSSTGSSRAKASTSSGTTRRATSTSSKSGSSRRTPAASKK